MSTELFPFLEETIKEFRKKRYYEYEASPPQSLLDQFKTSAGAYYHIARLFEDKYGYSAALGQEKLCIISTARVDNPTVCYFSHDDADQCEVKLRHIDELTFDPFVDDNMHIRNMLNTSIQKSLMALGFEFNGYSYYLKTEDLAKSLKPKNKFLARVQNFFHIYPGFNVRLRVLGGKPFLQIQPHCVIDFDKDLYSLYEEELFTFEEIPRVFPHILLPIRRTAFLQGFWKSKTASDPILDAVFHGQSFLQFARRAYKNLNFRKKDAKLIVVVPRGNWSNPWYFSSELAFPSFGFEDIATLDREFYYNVQSEMKVYSARRKDLVHDYFQQIENRLFFDDITIKLGGLYSYDNKLSEVEPKDFHGFEIKSFFAFPDPWVRFKDEKTLNSKDVSRKTGHLGAAGDLLRRPKDVRCFDVPSSINVRLMFDLNIESSVFALVHNLVEGMDRYAGFNDIFNVRVKFSFKTIDDFVDPKTYSGITPEDDDCVMIFGPRTIEGDPVKTKEIYTFSETQILNRGVPVQFISDDPAENPKYDKSLKTKSTNPDTLFGIGLNVLGKVGASVLTLSPATTDHFPPNSVVLGYNVARIFEPTKKDISQEASPRDLVSKSIPLAAPIVIFSGSGSEIIQQYAYEVADEVSLFSGEQGKRIISEIDGDVKNIIIHKDGDFHQKEIQDLKNLSERGRRIIPISIVSGFVPRLFSSFRKFNLPPVGAVFVLSDDDFLFSTTLTPPSYVPEHKGWPNPILVHFNEEALQPKLKSEEKMQLLYQIWSFTRANVHSQIPLRKPLSVHYSNRIAKFLVKAGDRSPSYFKNFKGRRNRLGYNPRIFL
jgi:hypothetical protein